MEAFKNGFAPQDQSLIDCKLPGLSSVVAQLSNSREIWFAERLGIEAMSRDFGDPNLFLTLNNSPRETYDTRLLLHKLSMVQMRNSIPIISSATRSVLQSWWVDMQTISAVKDDVDTTAIPDFTATAVTVQSTSVLR